MAEIVSRTVDVKLELKLHRFAPALSLNGARPHGELDRRRGTISSARVRMRYA